MELNALEFKILKLLSKQKAPVNLAFISKKCGECENSLNSLYNKNYITSSLIDDPEQLGFPSFEDTTITNDGREYLNNLSLHEKNKSKSLSKKQVGEIFIGIFIAVAGAIIIIFLNIQK